MPNVNPLAALESWIRQIVREECGLAPLANRAQPPAQHDPNDRIVEHVRAIPLGARVTIPDIVAALGEEVPSRALSTAIGLVLAREGWRLDGRMPGPGRLRAYARRVSARPVPTLASAAYDAAVAALTCETIGPSDIALDRTSSHEIAAARLALDCAGWTLIPGPMLVYRRPVAPWDGTGRPTAAQVALYARTVTGDGSTGYDAELEALAVDAGLRE